MSETRLEKVQSSLNSKARGARVDSFSALNTLLGAIPGIRTPLILVDQNIPLTKEEEEVKGGMALLTTLFESGQTVMLGTRYPESNTPADYQIGCRIGMYFVPVAYGLFSDIVKWLDA